MAPKLLDGLFRELADWIEIPSVTGEEGDYGDALQRALERRGFSVERQTVGPGRFNLLARAGEPDVVFCTHLDTVPPFFPSRMDRTHMHGRGACDAKGQVAAMLSAAEQLLARGEDRIGFLLTVGEEEDSDGAAFANIHRPSPWPGRFVIIGEPTDNTFVSAHKGIVKGHLKACGVAGHSSQRVGPSAIHELVTVCARLLESDWGHDVDLGPGTLNLGTIGGGVASNVVAPAAQAELMVRSVEPSERVLERVRALLGEHVSLDATSKATEPVHFEVPAGEASQVVAFG
ncbi:MAG: acetylornithine deacetylase, partial [Planctomycetota bacterium]